MGSIYEINPLLRLYECYKHVQICIDVRVYDLKQYKKNIYLASSYSNNMWCKALSCIACINQMEVQCIPNAQ